VSALASTAAPLGVAVIGAGTIGTLRARLVAAHPAVGSVCICDIDTERRDTLAAVVGAEGVYEDAAAAIAHAGVGAVIVATSEEQHFAPTMAAIEAGLPVLVEKPFTIDVDEGKALVEASERAGVPICVGFTQRFRRRYQSAKQHQIDGYLGALSTVNARIYITRAVAESVIRRAPTTTPSINTLTYSVDLLLWYAEGQRAISVYAQNSHGEISERFGAPDATSAIVTFDGGLVAALGVSWEPPRQHPAYVASMQLELFGRNGMLGINDDHRDQLLVSTEAVPSPYPPHVGVHAALLGSAMPGDWALGRFYGPMRDETDAFLDGVSARVMPPALPDARHGLAVLRLTRAIDESAAINRPVGLADVR
jgi:myo-inositol 2-dehydrogenase/D-chiro-inositol 1-dehydrogenase